MMEILHQQALRAARNHRKAEADLVGILIRIEDCRGFEVFGRTSLFAYAQKDLGLSEPLAQLLIYVGRKCREVPELLEAIENGELTVSKSKTIVPVIDRKNFAKWIGIAKRVSTRNLERAVAAEQPSTTTRESIRYKGKGARIAVDLDEEGLNALQRSREILAQKKSAPVNMADSIKATSIRFIEQNDPVAKADRATRKTIHVNGKSSRKHKVHHRDRGQCQFRLPTGELCGASQWLHIHHIKPRAEGGTDDPENLITLCSSHHRQVHKH
jgi:hypothetical protein